MNKMPRLTKIQFIQQIWKILNEFRLAHFFSRYQSIIDIDYFDEMMEKVRQELLAFEDK
jgi:hypothetical protein